eukprot:5584007-Amphidinium_carterae.1
MCNRTCTRARGQLSRVVQFLVEWCDHGSTDCGFVGANLLSAVPRQRPSLLNDPWYGQNNRRGVHPHCVVLCCSFTKLPARPFLQLVMPMRKPCAARK